MVICSKRLQIYNFLIKPQILLRHQSYDYPATASYLLLMLACTTNGLFSLSLPMPVRCRREKMIPWARIGLLNGPARDLVVQRMQDCGPLPAKEIMKQDGVPLASLLLGILAKHLPSTLGGVKPARNISETTPHSHNAWQVARW